MFTVCGERVVDCNFLYIFFYGTFSLCLFGRCWYCYYFFSFHPEFSSSFSFQFSPSASFAFLQQHFQYLCVINFSITPTNPTISSITQTFNSMSMITSNTEEIFLLFLAILFNTIISSSYLYFILRMKIYQWYLYIHSVYDIVH